MTKLDRTLVLATTVLILVAGAIVFSLPTPTTTTTGIVARRPIPVPVEEPEFKRLPAEVTDGFVFLVGESRRYEETYAVQVVNVSDQNSYNIREIVALGVGPKSSPIQAENGDMYYLGSREHPVIRRLNLRTNEDQEFLRSENRIADLFVLDSVAYYLEDGCSERAGCELRAYDFVSDSDTSLKTWESTCPVCVIQIIGVEDDRLVIANRGGDGVFGDMSFSFFDLIMKTWTDGPSYSYVGEYEESEHEEGQKERNDAFEAKVAEIDAAITEPTCGGITMTTPENSRFVGCL